jgi:hypothetical protein
MTKQKGAPPQKNKQKPFTYINVPVSFEENEALKNASLDQFGKQSKPMLIRHLLKPIFDKINK